MNIMIGRPLSAAPFINAYYTPVAALVETSYHPYNNCKPCNSSGPTSSWPDWWNPVPGWTNHLLPHWFAKAGTWPNPMTTHTHWHWSSCTMLWMEPGTSRFWPGRLVWPSRQHSIGSSRSSSVGFSGRQCLLIPSSCNLWEVHYPPWNCINKILV